MSVDSIVMLIISLVVLWGGMIWSILRLPKE